MMSVGNFDGVPTIQLFRRYLGIYTLLLKRIQNTAIYGMAVCLRGRIYSRSFFTALYQLSVRVLCFLFR